MCRPTYLGFTFVIVVSFVGCTPSNAPPPPAAKVTGTVKLDGNAMTGGEVRFSTKGQPAKIFEIRDGAFSGEAFVGANQIEVIWEKDGPPSPMDPKILTKVNAVADAFSGPNSKLNAEVKAPGPNEFKFEVTSKR